MAEKRKKTLFVRETKPFLTEVALSGGVSKMVVKVVKVKMVIFIFGFGHLLTIYKYKIFIIVADFDNQKTILTKMTMTKMTASCREK